MCLCILYLAELKCRVVIETVRLRHPLVQQSSVEYRNVDDKEGERVLL